MNKILKMLPSYRQDIKDTSRSVRKLSYREEDAPLEGSKKSKNDARTNLAYSRCASLYRPITPTRCIPEGTHPAMKYAEVKFNAPQPIFMTNFWRCMC